MAEFEDCDFLVAPSGSCSGMIRTHYADLFADEPAMGTRVAALAAKTRELTDFLVNELKLERVPGRFDGAATYHDSCAGLREMGVKAQPRALLAMVPGLELVEMAECETCCGFGGTFSIKFGEISARLADNKCGHIAASGAGRGGARRSRLHAEHRGPAAPARRHDDPGAARRRDARGRRAMSAPRAVRDLRPVRSRLRTPRVPR